MPAPEPLVHLVADQEAQGQAKELFNQLKEKTGTVPKWVRVMANCPDILVGFFTMFKATMDDAPVEAGLKWKIAYQVSEMNKCEFCVSVSIKQLKSLGLSEKDIADIDKIEEAAEKAALEYAAASTKEAYRIDPQIIKQMKQHYSDEQIVEITAVVGLFNYINRFNDALGVLPEA